MFQKISVVLIAAMLSVLQFAGIAHAKKQVIKCPFPKVILANVLNKLPKRWEERTYIPMTLQTTKILTDKKWGKALTCRYQAVNSASVTIDVQLPYPAKATCATTKGGFVCKTADKPKAAVKAPQIMSPEALNEAIKILKCVVDCPKLTDEEMMNELVLWYGDTCREACSTDCIDVYENVDNQSRFEPACKAP